LTREGKPLLWRELHFWKRISQPYCFCRLCAMEQLLNLANQNAHYKKRLHNNIIKRWNKSKLPGMKWLINFEMRFGFSKIIFPNCLKMPIVAQKLANKSKFSRLLSKSHSRRSGL